MSTINFIGLGTMGAPMVRCLTAAGHTVYVTDVDLEAATRVAEEAGAILAPDARRVPAVDALILMLPNSAVVQSVLGENADLDSLVQTLAVQTLIIDMSSSKPEETQANAVRLADLRLRFIDAPVSGGPVKAASGELSIMVGGSEEDVQAARPILEAMGTSIMRTGPVGSAHALKALNNLLSVIGVVGGLEVLAIGKRFGLDPRLMLDVINVSTGRNHATEMKIGQQVLSRQWNVGFSLALTVKDIDTALALAATEHLTVPVSAAAVAVAHDALVHLTGTNADQSEIAKFIEYGNGLSFSD